MNWEAIGAAGELVSAIVVVVSVAYLAYQIRQNTIASRAETFRTLSIEFSRQFAGWGQDKEVSGHFYKVFYEGSVRSDFKPEETQAISFSLIARIALYDAAYRSFKEGILKEAEFVPMLNSRIWSLPFTLDSWPIYRQELSPDFVSYIEKQFPELGKAK